MNKLLSFVFIFVGCQCIYAKSVTNNNYNKVMPFLFMENKGQIHNQNGDIVSEVLFTASDGDFKVQLTKNGLQYYLQKVNNPGKTAEKETQKMASQNTGMPEAHDTAQISYTIQRLDIKLLGANPNPEIVPEGKTDYYENYYLSGCGDKGITGVHGYNKVTYRNIYQDIDWVIYAKNGRLKYDFVVHAGANAAQIKIQYKGADSLVINKDGSFSAVTPLGTITEAKPYSFVQSDGRIVISGYQLNNNILSFAIQQQNETIVIDPNVTWATYYGGNSFSVVWQGGLYADGIGGVYTSGYTNATTNIATTGAYQTVLSSSSDDACLAKFDSSGTRLWATYFGGGGAEDYNMVTGDGGANVYLSGSTNSTGNIATTGAHQTTMGGNFDCYLARFTNSGLLIWSTYYGGPAVDYAEATCDASGNIFLSGYTSSTINIATAGAYQSSFSGMEDFFLVKFNSAGVRQWGTYFGGSGDERGYSAACNISGDVYIAGSTSSTSGVSTTTGFQPAFGGGNYDVFLAKFTSSGNIVWSTYYGGGGEDGYFSTPFYYGGRMIQCDANGNIYLQATTGSNNGIASSGAYQTTLAGLTDIFLAKFNANGQRLWGTYYGGSSSDYGIYISTDNTGNYVYVMGSTASTMGIATAGSYQTANMGGTYDACMARFNANGQLAWGSYFGGTSYDWGSAIAFEPPHYFYIGGSTTSTSGIATQGAYQTIYSGSAAGYLARFADTTNALHIGNVTLLYCQGDSIHIPFYSLAVFGTGNVFTAELSDNAGSFANPVVLGSKTGTGFSDTINAMLPTTINGTGYKLRIHSSNAPLISDTLSLVINPLVSPTVAITASTSSVCPNGIISFTAVTTNSGSTPAYKWIKNNAIVGTGNSYSVTGNWGAGDSVYCVINSNALCTIHPVDTSNVIHITVLPGITPTLSITSSSLIICSGQPVSFNASATSSGTLPVYQWMKNSAPVGYNIPTYNDSNFVNGDTVICKLISNYPCAIPSQVLSNPLIVSVLPPINPVITRINDTLTVNAGSSGLIYQWYFNGIPIIDATNKILIIHEDGIYTVLVTDTLGCKALSGGLSVTGLSVNIISNRAGIKIYPNPATGIVFIDAPEKLNVIVRNTLSQIVFSINQTDKIDIGSLTNGLYMLLLTDKEGRQVTSIKLMKTE